MHRKAEREEKDAYSAFQNTGLTQSLRGQDITRLFIGDLATDYCVLNTVQDARRANFHVLLMTDAIRAVDVRPGDGDAAIAAMLAHNAVPVTLDQLDGTGDADIDFPSGRLDMHQAGRLSAPYHEHLRPPYPEAGPISDRVSHVSQEPAFP